jgi:uracil-DNA glycosylase
VLRRGSSATSPGKDWPTDAARERVAKLVEPYDVVVLMGRKAQVAYGKIIVVRAPFFSWVEDPFVESTRPRQVVAIPHSSGLNRAYNDPAARVSAGCVLREAIERARITSE